MPAENDAISAPSPVPEPTQTTSRWRRARVAALLFVVGVVGLSLPAWDRLLEPSPHFHFVDLAESYMQGRLDTDTPNRRRGQKQRPEDPPGYAEAIDRHLTGADGKATGFNDWASFRVLKLVGGETVMGVFPWKDTDGSQKNHFRTLDGQDMIIDVSKDVAKGCGGKKWKRCDEKRYFVSFPPFPAIAVMPFAAIFHYDFNDVIFTVFLGALNLVLLFLLLEALRTRGWTTRTRRENVLLALLFTFGTVHYFSAVRGEVWFTALVMGVTLHLGFIWASLDARRPFVAGLLLALGFATRTPIAFCFVFFAIQLLFPGGRWSGSPFGEKLKKGVLFAIPILAVGVTLMALNQARFGNPFEFGHTFLMEGTRASIRDHGLFSSQFLNRNLSAALTNMPRIDGTKPFIHLTRHGLGLIATTPFFLYLLWPLRKGWDDTDTFRHRLLWITVAVSVIPSLFYQNTGWAQFGYRFSLDWSPYLFVLLAMSRRPLTKRAMVLLAVCVVINLFGAVTFGRMGQFYYD